jgi:hypothetical protein
MKPATKTPLVRELLFLYPRLKKPQIFSTQGEVDVEKKQCGEVESAKFRNYQVLRICLCRGSSVPRQF